MIYCYYNSSIKGVIMDFDKTLSNIIGGYELQYGIIYGNEISCLSNAEQAALYQRAEVCRLRWLRTTPCSFLTRYCLKKNYVRLQCLQIIKKYTQKILTSSK